MAAQRPTIPLKCSICRQPVQSCTCGSETTISSAKEAFPTGFAATAPEQPYLDSTTTCSGIGSTVDQKYELVAQLGSGGMGTVFKARHLTLPKFFAIKILKRELSNDVEFRARFDQEAKTASLLNHPHLVSIYDHGTTDYDEAYLIMDFIDGHSLESALTRQKRIEQRQAVKVFAQICEGLAHAHGLGVIHRDLKPSNVMLQPGVETDFVKVVDFGIAKMVSESGGITQSLTKTGEFFGSPLYMSPEQSTGARPDHRTDIYSMGILMYECLTSAPPFRGENFFITISLHNEAQPKPFEKSLGISDELENIVIRALEKDPDHRFQSMEELRLALLGVFGDDTVVSRAKKASPKAVRKNQVQSDSQRSNELDSGPPKSKLALLAGCALALIVTAAAGTYCLMARTGQPALPNPVKLPDSDKIPPAQSKLGQPAKAIATESDSASSPPPALPSIPDSIVLPDSDKKMSPQMLVDAGLAVQRQNGENWQNLLPARYFTSAAKVDPKFAQAYESLTEFYWHQRDMAPAGERKEALEKCLAVDSEEIKQLPNSFQAYFHRNMVNCQLERWSEALADADRGVKLNPNNSDMHLNRAYALLGLHHWKEAIAEYEQYIRPTDLSSMYLLGISYQHLHEDEKVIEFSSKWIKILGPQEQLLFVRADSEKTLGMYKEALSDYETLVKKWPKNHAARDLAIEECKKMIAGQGKN